MVEFVVCFLGWVSESDLFWGAETTTDSGDFLRWHVEIPAPDPDLVFF